MRDALDIIYHVLLIESISEIECCQKIKVENNIVVSCLKGPDKKFCLEGGRVEMYLYLKVRDGHQKWNLV